MDLTIWISYRVLTQSVIVERFAHDPDGSVYPEQSKGPAVLKDDTARGQDLIIDYNRYQEWCK